MKKLVLTYVGEDFWGNPTYTDNFGKYFKDVNWGSVPELCTCDSIEGEPDTPIEKIKKYQGFEVEILNQKEETTEDEKFNYMMLSRLQSDCDYYLGFGNKNADSLWAHSEIDQISEMKKLWNYFEEHKKPLWINWNQILEYESKMCKH